MTAKISRSWYKSRSFAVSNYTFIIFFYLFVPRVDGHALQLPVYLKLFCIFHTAPKKSHTTMSSVVIKFWIVIIFQKRLCFVVEKY